MSSEFQDAAVVVIGGTSGIGLATAAMVAAAGARVTVVGRNEERLAGALEQLGGGAEGAALDVGEVMMQNAWEQGPDDPAAMLLRVRTTLPEADAACVPYEIVYGHFSG